MNADDRTDPGAPFRTGWPAIFKKQLPQHIRLVYFLALLKPEIMGYNIDYTMEWAVSLRFRTPPTLPANALSKSKVTLLKVLLQK